MRIVIGLDPADIDAAISHINEYAYNLKDRCNELCRRLAEYGELLATVAFDGVQYLGLKDVTVSVEQTDNGYLLLANGETALLLEFGAGVTLGDGHPEAEMHDMGPGTYPDGKGHWKDPNGWYLPKEKGGGHTYGNIPGKAMYDARQQMKDSIERIAREVFAP